MFRKFFLALANLTDNVDELSSSVREANQNFRSNMGLDNKPEPEQLEHHEPSGKRKKAS